MIKKTQRLDFQTACTSMLKELGAVDDPDGYGLLLNTIAGGLQCRAYGDWLATRFNDVQQANVLVDFGSLNRFSGKWNWHFSCDTETTPEDLDYLKSQLERVLVK
ncbi:MAG: hypothetical protein RJA34_2471 [Pseudomonadota bacterium]|jgi:hypothetical protein